MKALILCCSLFLTLPAGAETLTLANGQRCTVLRNGELAGCTAPTSDRDRADAKPRYPAYGAHSPRASNYPADGSRPSPPKTRRVNPAGWTPKY